MIERMKAVAREGKPKVAGPTPPGTLDLASDGESAEVSTRTNPIS